MYIDGWILALFGGFFLGFVTRGTMSALKQIKAEKEFKVMIEERKKKALKQGQHEARDMHPEQRMKMKIDEDDVDSDL